MGTLSSNIVVLVVPFYQIIRSSLSVQVGLNRSMQERP